MNRLLITILLTLNLEAQDRENQPLPIQTQVKYLLSCSSAKIPITAQKEIELHRNDPQAIKSILINVNKSIFIEKIKRAPKPEISSEEAFHAANEARLAKENGDIKIYNHWNTIAQKYKRQLRQSIDYTRNLYNTYVKAMARLAGWIPGTASSDLETGCQILKIPVDMKEQLFPELSNAYSN